MGGPSPVRSVTLKQPITIPRGATLEVSAEGARIAEMLQTNYAFVVNVSRIVGADSLTLAPGHELRRASAQEASAIREVLQHQMSGPALLPWEHRQAAGGQVEPMPEADWRYFVISYDGTNQTLTALEQAFSVAPMEIKIGFTVFSHLGGRGLIWNPARLFQLLDRAWWNLAFVEVAAPDVEAVAVIHAKIQQHDHRLVDVKRLLNQLQDLEAVPSRSPLQFLGHFAILESLLTHPPKPTDPYDSITRQVKRKVTLIDHRCQPRIDYSSFAGTNAETVWTKMYAYRSSLAHGGAPAFDGEFQTLGSPDNALRLVKQTSKAVIRQALIEPQLLADLRDC
jgi:hypothetical protein